jgi:hypothetical protein
MLGLFTVLESKSDSTLSCLIQVILTTLAYESSCYGLKPQGGEIKAHHNK